MTIQPIVAGPAAWSFTAPAGALVDAMAAISRAVARRNTIPILANVLIELASDGGTVTLTGTNLDSVAVHDVGVWAGGKVPGDCRRAVTVGAHVLEDILRKCEKGGQVELTAADGKIVVVSGKARQSIATMPADNFPALAIDKPRRGVFVIPADDLAQILALCAPFVSTDESRYYLQGIHVSAARDEAGKPALVYRATDGRNLVEITKALPAGAAGLARVKDGFIIPRGLLALVGKRLAKATGSVAVAISDDRAAIIGDGWRYAGKLIDGTFPSFAAVYSQNLGDDLQSVAFPECHDTIDPAAFALLRKATAGAALICHAGATANRFTSPDLPGFAAVQMAGKPSARYAGNFPGEATARDYLASLARSRGFDPDSFRDNHGAMACHLHKAGAEIIGATFGNVASHETRVFDEVLNYDTFQVEKVARVIPAEYEPGAFSIEMPRERRLMAVDTYIDANGNERAMDTDKGKIPLTAEQVRALSGDPADFPRREIPPLPAAYRCAVLPPGWSVMVTGKPWKVPRGLRGEGYWKWKRANPAPDNAPFWSDAGGHGARDWNREIAAGNIALQPGVGVDAGVWFDHAAAACAEAWGKEAEAVASGPAAAIRPIVPENAPEAASADPDKPEALPDDASEAPPTVKDGLTVADDGDVSRFASAADDLRAAPWRFETESADPGIVAAIDPAPDLAALVIELLARVAALESKQAAPVAEAPAAGGDDVGIVRDIYQGMADSALSEADELRRQLAAMTADRNDWQAIAEQNKARLDGERSDFAQLNANYDSLVQWARATRQRTAGRLRSIRATAREAEALHAIAVNDAAIARKDAGEALQLRLAALAQVENVERDNRKLRMTGAAFSGFRYSGGHLGAAVAGERGPANPAYLATVGDRRAA